MKRAVTVLLGMTVFVTACNLRVGPPEREDPALGEQRRLAANEQLVAVAKVGNILLTPADLVGSWSELDSNESIRSAYPAPALVACLGLASDAARPFGSSSRLTVTVTPVKAPEVPALAISKLLRRDDITYAMSIGIVTDSPAKAKELFAIASVDAYATCVFKRLANGEATVRALPEENPNVWLAESSWSQGPGSTAIAYNGGIAVQYREAKVAVILLASPVSSGKQDILPVINSLFQRM